MTEVEAARPAVAAEVAELPGTSFGRRLADARVKLGLSIEDVAARLRLHPKQVQAIENEVLPALPAPFLRGFVRNYAKELRLDSAPLIAELNARLGPQAGAPLRAESGSSALGRAVRGDLSSRRIVVVGVLVALVALAVVGGLATRGDQRGAESAAQPAAPVVAAAPVLPPPAEEKKPEALPSPQPEAMPPAPPAVVAAAPARSGSLRLSFQEQAWVEVTQADGRVVHSQLNEPGTEQRIEAMPPLRLVIGNASSVLIDYKGKLIDLKPVTNAENVARITLN